MGLFDFIKNKNKNNNNEVIDISDNYITNKNTVKTFNTIDNEEIYSLIIKWLELLSKEEYEEALNMFQTFSVDTKWTPENLKMSIYSYGMPWMGIEEIKEEFGKINKVTSIEDFKLNKEKNIDIEESIMTSEKAKIQRVSFMDYENIVGDVEVENIPLNGKESDLTATFYIKKLDDNKYTLCFLNLHVM